jgi:protein-disulfide isomerase
MKRTHRLGLLGVSAVAIASLVACQAPGNISKIEESLNKIAEKQDELLTKVGDLEGKIGKAPAGAPPQPQQPAGPDPTATYKVPVGDAHAKGPADAKVTIVEWSDFQCPFCSRVGPTLEELAKDYGSDLRIAFKHNPLPFHNRAQAAALAAEAAGNQGKFWEMHDKLFANQKDLTDENFEKWAKELGVDVGKFKKDMEDEALKKKVAEQQKQGNNLGARGTPAFFINGRYLSGAQPTARFKAVIDEEMKKVDKLIADGTPKDKVYDKVIEKGKMAP